MLLNTRPRRSPFVTSTLIQMEDLAISKKSLTGAVRVFTVPTRTNLKLHLDRDEWQGDWREFQQQITDPTNTSSGFGHRQSGTIVVSVRSGTRMLDKQLLKVWGWFFQTAVHGKASPKDAQLFTAPADRSPPLRHVSGVGGLYVESRDVSGRSPRQGEQDIDILGLAIHTIPSKGTRR